MKKKAIFCSFAFLFMMLFGKNVCAAAETPVTAALVMTDPTYEEFLKQKKVEHFEVDHLSVADALHKLYITITPQTDFVEIAFNFVLLPLPPNIQQQKISFRLENGNAMDVLNKICDLTGLHFQYDRYAILIGKGSSPKNPNFRLVTRTANSELHFESFIARVDYLNADFLKALSEVTEIAIADEKSKINGVHRLNPKVTIMKGFNPRETVNVWARNLPYHWAVVYFCMSANIPYSATEEQIYIGRWKK